MTFEFNPSETEGTALLQGRVTQAEAIAQAKVLSWKQAKGVGGTEQWRGDQGRVEREEVRFRIFFFGDEANRTCSLYSTGICIQYPVINRNGKEMYNTYIVAVVVYLLVMSNSFGPIDCSLPGSYIHGISQARLLE